MSMNSLPVELHTSILEHLLLLSREPFLGRNPHRSPLLPPVKFVWTNLDTRSASLFPFNVVSVSKLWRDILALIPECWTRIVFDVAKDPTPLLDAFLWSENAENLEVFVFNSDSSQTTDKTHEQSYVLAIATALYPHIHRCTSITFDVTYATSLPSPTMFFTRGAPYLEELCLDCSIDDIDHDQKNIRQQRDLATSFPELRTLSLTGFWFMDLVLHALSRDWFEQLSLGIEDSCSLSLSISRFTFPRHGPYSLAEFVSYISSVDIGSFWFNYLSLAYAYDDLEPKADCAYNIYPDSHFRSVSKDFLIHLDTLARVRCYYMPSFEACEIPQLKMVQYADRLELIDVIDDDIGTNLRNLLALWSGIELSIFSCPSLNDTFLSWLVSEQEYSVSLTSNMDSEQRLRIFPARNMTTLKIIDCNNISLRALRELSRLRHEATSMRALKRRVNESTDEEPAENHLIVTGKGLVLSDEEKIWYEQVAENMAVYWKEEIFQTVK